MFPTFKPGQDADLKTGGMTLADFYPLAGVVSIATYLVVECLLG